MPNRNITSFGLVSIVAKSFLLSSYSTKALRWSLYTIVSDLQKQCFLPSDSMLSTFELNAFLGVSLCFCGIVPMGL